MSNYTADELRKLTKTSTQIEYYRSQLTLLKDQSLQVDKQRQACTQGLAQIRHRRNGENAEQGNMIWVNNGAVFLEVNMNSYEEQLRQEQVQLNAQYDQIRSKQKVLAKKVLELAPNKSMDQASLDLLLAE